MASAGDKVAIVIGADGLPVAGPVGAPAVGDKAALVMGADGLPVAIAGAAGGNPCDPDPSMDLTVTGAVTATVNWCGKTWNLPGDSGKTEVDVCPTGYGKGYVKSATSWVSTGVIGQATYIWRAFHFWRHTTSVGNILSLNRQAATFKTVGGKYFILPPRYGHGFGFNYNELKVKGERDYGGFFGGFSPYDYARPVSVTYADSTAAGTYWKTTIGAVSAIGRDNVSTGYAGLIDAYFPAAGHTIGGITYKWEKGQGW